MSISVKESYSISQLSQASHKSFVNQGLIDKISFKSINDFFLFPFYDELLQMVKLNPFFPYLLTIILLAQAYKSFSKSSKNEISNFFIDFDFSQSYELITIPLFYFLFDIFYFVYLIMQYRYKRMFNYWQLYLSAIILSFFNVIFFLPVCGVCGSSIVQLNQIVTSHCSNNTAASNFTEVNSRLYYLNYNTSLKNFSNNYNNNYQNKINEKFYLKNKQKDGFSIFNDRKFINLDKNKKKRKEFNGFKKVKLKTDFYVKNETKSIKNDNFQYLEGIEIQDPIYVPNNPINDNESEYKKKRNEYNSKVIKYGFSIIFTIIQATIHSIQIFYNFHFISYSPYLDRTILGMWDSKVFTSYILLMGINNFVTKALTIFPSWCTIAYHIFVIFVDIYIFYYTIFQPFIKISTNCFFQSLLSFNLFSNIVTIVYNFKPFRTYNFIMLYILLFLIPLSFVYYFINKKIISVVNKKLSPKAFFEDQQDSNEETNSSDEIQILNSDKILSRNDENTYQMTDEEKRQIFDKYVFQSTEHALLYLRVGVSNLSPFFIDFSFIRYMKETYNYMPIQLFILRLMSFFPSEHQYLNYGVSILSKREEFMSYFEQFLMYQLHRINIVRQSNVSKELQNELFLLDKMSDDAISAIRSFWVEIFQARTEFEMSSLRFIRKMTLNTKSCYIDALEKFPNSTQILNSYCRFLCEGCGDYVECARYGQKIRLIEQGKHINTDFCFNAFVNVFPQYLKKRILNEKGSFIHTDSSVCSSISSQLSSAISTGQISASFDNISNLQNMSTSSNESSKNYSLNNQKRTKVDLENLIEQENFETLINTLFSNGKSRLIIQQIVERSRNKSLLLAMIISIVQAVIFVIITLLELGFINSFESPIYFLESAARTSKIAFSFQYCSLVAGVQYLSETYKSNISAKIIEFLNIREENLPNFACTFINPMVSLSAMVKSVYNLIDSEMKFILKNPAEHKEEISAYTTFNFDDKYHSSHNNKDWLDGLKIYKINISNNNYSRYNSTLRNALEYFAAVVDRLSFEQSLERAKYMLNNTLLDMSKFNDVYFELLVNGLAISEPFSHLFQIISEDGIKKIKSNERILIIALLVISIFCVLAFSLFRIYCFCEIKKVLDIQETAIKKVRNDDIIELMKPIYLKSQRIIKIHSTNGHSIYESSPILYFYELISFFSIFILFGFLVFSVSHFKSTFKFIKNAQKWENDASSRFLHLAMMMNYYISNNIVFFQFNFSHDYLQNSMRILDLSQKLDLSIIREGKQLRDFYFMINENSSAIKGDQRHTNAETKNVKNIFYKKNLLKNKKFILSDEDEIDLLFTNQKCDELDNSDLSHQMNFATFLDCISIENKVNLGIHYYIQMENSFENSSNLLDMPEFITFLFILDKYLYQDMPKFQDIISSTAKDELMTNKTHSMIIGGVGGVLSIVFLIIDLIMLTQINFGFEAFKQLILVLPPSAFSNNSILTNFLICSYTKSKNPFFSKIEAIHSNTLSEVEILFNAVNEGIVNTDENLIIQSVNPAVQKMTGFLPDQLLGQSILYLIPLTQKNDKNASIEKYPFYQRVDEIKGSNCDRVAELNIKVLTDKGQEILVEAIIIGMFDKKKKSNQKLNLRLIHLSNLKNGFSELFNEKGDNDSLGEDTDNESTASTTYESTLNLNYQQHQLHNYDTDDEEAEEFSGITVILRDISKERKLKKDLKKTIKNNEILLNLLIPQPVLETIRASKKSAYYVSNPATLIKFELNGFDEYTGTMMPKTIMNNLQIIYSKIDKILKKNDETKQFSLFNREEKETQNQSNQQQNDGMNQFFGKFQQNQVSIMRFNFNFDLNSHDELDEDIRIHEVSNANLMSSRNIKTQRDDDEEINIENDENCDFSCIYNIRNDNDQLIYVAGLFDSQDELKKQAESCLRFALKVNKLIENISLEDQINMFIHIKISVCMGGPIYGFVDDPNNPQIEILSDLMNEVDVIKNQADLDVVYINENIYNNINKENFEIEEKIIQLNNDKDEFDDSQKIYAVHKCLKKKKNVDDAFAISSDNEN